MENIANKFDDLFSVISTEEFLNMESLGGEIPFFISAFDAQQQKEVDLGIKGLKNKLENKGIPVCEINLYDIVISILDEKLGLEKMFRIEKKKSKAKFLKALQSSLNIHQVLMPKIQELIGDSGAKIYFLTGIGLVFPYIRSHNILNNLQNVAKEAPTVTFFPGNYNGQSLDLFGLLKDDNYYRAFNLKQYKLK